MTKNILIKHAIQQHIIDLLSGQEFARFSDLRPPSVETNLFTYHLQVLVRRGLVAKINDGYKLNLEGLRYASETSPDNAPRSLQPDVVSVLVVQNSNGDLLLQKRDRQPYINTWTLPGARLYADDQVADAPIKRIAAGQLKIVAINLRHAGEAYVRVYGPSGLITATLTHVYRLESDDVRLDDTLVWVQPHRLSEYQLAPGTESIVTRSFFNDDCFFEEYDERWS